MYQSFCRHAADGHENNGKRMKAMSASTKRKTRQAEIEAGTYKKQAAQKERDEKKAKERRTIRLCIAFVR